MLCAAPCVARAQDVPVAEGRVAEPIFSPAVAASAATPRVEQWRTSFTAWRAGAGPMLPLYAAFTTLQILDAHSTTRAIANGATERNAMMSGVAGHPIALTAVKLSATASTIFLTEKLRKRNRLAAIATMAGIDTVYAIIDAHNYRAIR